MNEKFTDLVGQLIYGKTPRGYNFMSVSDRRELYRIWCEMDKGNKPEFINGNVKRVLDKFKIKTLVCGIGWKVA